MIIKAGQPLEHVEGSIRRKRADRAFYREDSKL